MNSLELMLKVDLIIMSGGGRDSYEEVRNVGQKI